MAESSPLPSALASLLGPAGLLTEPTDLAPALADWRSLYQGRALALLRGPVLGRNARGVHRQGRVDADADVGLDRVGRGDGAAATSHGGAVSRAVR